MHLASKAEMVFPSSQRWCQRCRCRNKEHVCSQYFSMYMLSQSGRDVGVWSLELLPQPYQWWPVTITVYYIWVKQPHASEHQWWERRMCFSPTCGLARSNWWLTVQNWMLGSMSLWPDLAELFLCSFPFFSKSSCRAANLPDLRESCDLEERMES